MKRYLIIARTLWIAVIVSSALALYSELADGNRFDTNVLSLLPKDERDPITFELSQRVSSGSENRIGFMVTKQSDGSSEQILSAVRDGLAPLVEWDSSSMKSLDGVVGAYIPYGRRLLLRSDIEMAESQPSRFFDALLKKLYSPSAGFYSRFLSADPLLLAPRFLEKVPRCSSAMPTIDGFLEGSTDIDHVIVLSGKVRGNSLDQRIFGPLVERLEQLREDLEPEYSRLGVRPLGALWFAERISSTLQRETSIIGTTALFATSLLFLFAFRSLTALLLTLIPLAAGSIVATALSLFIFPSLHVITLAFGSVLIGACTDYGLHLLAVIALSSSEISRERILRSILPGLTLGMVTTTLSFLALLFTPLPGLEQLACFAVAGLISSFVTTVLILPPLIPQSLGSRVHHNTHALARGVLSVIRHPFVATWAPYGACGTLVFLAITALTTVRTGDDVRLFASPQPDLLQSEREVQRAFGGIEPLRYALVEGTTQAETVERSATFRQIVLQDKVVEAACDISLWTPVIRDQQASGRAVESLITSRDYHKYRSSVGLPADFQVAPLTSALEPELLRNTTAFPLVHEFWLGKTERGFAGIIRFQKIIDADRLERLAAKSPGITFVDRTAFVSELLGRYRSRAMQIMLCAYAFVALILIARYGVRGGAACMGPPLVALFTSLTVLSLCGGSVNVFTIFAMLLTLGLGVDFAVFFLEGEGHESGTILAILVSSLTAATSTALLALTSTPMLSQFGISVASGILAAMVSAPFVSVLAARLPKIQPVQQR